MSRNDEGAAVPPPIQTIPGPLKFQITMASDPRLLAVVRSTVAQIAELWGFGEEECRAVTHAVDEAMSNIIRHAYKNRYDREIKLSCRAQGNCLEFTVNDSGEPADPKKICAQPLDGVALGGRGTHLIRQTMDEVHYDRVGEGNRLRLKKYLPGTKSKG